MGEAHSFPFPSPFSHPITVELKTSLHSRGSLKGGDVASKMPTNKTSRVSSARRIKLPTVTRRARKTLLAACLLPFFCILSLAEVEGRHPNAIAPFERSN
jgi:hypothetical protein